ncbi:MULTISPECIES: glycosyltransferase family 4 protein [unclassified Bacteroides]|uniref:glycosyltransferase family 4 protein n=1 Tax=unclassified Bacteroides TaxID=2646097 RepID=UPI0004E2111F|nr:MULTISPECIES: glycosyltransferase family 4 protein [unclassified Bacteroides]MBO4598416.1 glycosyltransferase family 4 protein [Bacteroidaceae bacterium]
MEEKKKMRIAAFGGFRDIPPRAGGAGSDKFAVELYPRIVKRGYSLLAYTRIYPNETREDKNLEYEGIRLKPFKTVSKAGFDSLLHSCKCTWDVIVHDTADVVHLHSGANSLWALFLRLAGKKVVVSQFAMDWKRDKWPWYGKLYYLFSNYLTAHIPNAVVFDNVYTKEYYEKKYNKTYDFIPYGSEVPEPSDNTDILDKLSLKKGEYFLFVGRFIPDKGLHLLKEAFEGLKTDKKLVMIGGSPNPNEYESKIKTTSDSRIICPGYVYGEDTNILMKNAYAYCQPSLIEGLSPVILTVMGLGTPLICSDIRENTFITKDNAITFESGNAMALREVLQKALDNPELLKKNAIDGQKDIKERFNWESITDQYIHIMRRING